MTMNANSGLSVFAPAKINLYLHIMGKKADGYHDIDSLIAFADIGDEITLTPATRFTFHAQGPFADAFTEAEKIGGMNSANLAVRGAIALARISGKIPNVTITLTKNLPLASGIGGGSADAAAVLRGLAQLWNISLDSPEIRHAAAALGADIHACLLSSPARARGIGEILSPAPAFPPLPVLLVNPGTHCPTSAVFKAFSGPFKNSVSLPDRFSDFRAGIDFLETCNNDLTNAASIIAPEIGTVLGVLKECAGCALARMTGSGATCFGLFEKEEAARRAAQEISRRHPQWWAQAGVINSP